MSSVVKIGVLQSASNAAFYPTMILMTYLTNVWKLDFTHAAAIINVFFGAMYILPLFMSVLVDAYMGDFFMLALSSVAYSFGQGFLAMSTPPVLSKLVGNCSAYEPECIGGTQKVLFYTALLLICIGIAGYMSSLKSFMAIHGQQVLQELFNDSVDNNKVNWRGCMYIAAGGLCAVFIPALALVVYALPIQHSWAIVFGIPAICTVLATLIFFTGSRSYIKTPATTSLLITMSRVLVASASKLSYCTPIDVNQLYGLSSPDSLVHTRSLSYLDKAAIILPNKTLEQQEVNRWKLCSVTEVEITKMVIRKMPVIMAYFAFGIISPIQNTFFIEQANHMNPKVGWFKSLPICLAFGQVGIWVAIIIYSIIGAIMDALGVEKYIPTTGFLMAMTASILCCSTAALVEETRLDSVMMNHNILNNPDETIPMSILWLFPQFLLIGAVESFFLAGGQSYLQAAELPNSLLPLVRNFCFLVHGMGHIGSVLLVYSVGKVSGSGNKSSWFQETLNQSRLDNYYWTLTIISVFSMVLYILSLCHKFQASNPTIGSPDETMQEEHID